MSDTLRQHICRSIKAGRSERGNVARHKADIWEEVKGVLYPLYVAAMVVLVILAVPILVIASFALPHISLPTLIVIALLINLSNKK